MFTFFNSPSERPDVSMNFARRRSRGYMMRSEKRTPYRGSNPNAKRPQRRRKKAGFFYILLMLLLSLILWPVGMWMLWRRKVRWTISSKLLTTIITLFLSVTMFGYAITVQTDNPQITMVQDGINDFIDNGAIYISEGYTAICDGAVQIWNSAADLGDAAGRASLAYLADGIDKGVDLTSTAVGAIVDLLPENQPTEAPVVTDEPTDEPTDAPETTVEATPEATPEVTGGGDLPLTVPETTPDPNSAQPIGNGTLNRDGEFVEATATPEPTAEPTAAPTDVPTAVPTDAPTAEPTAEPTDAPTDEPAASPKATEAAEPTATATVEPTGTPEPTAKPTAEPSPSPEVDESLTPAPAKEAVVYYTSNGKYYHMASTCKGMKGAKAHTLGEAAARKLKRCNNCGTPDASILKAENPVWIDKANLFHLSAECENFTGKWSLAELDKALNSGVLPCEVCRADVYMTTIGKAVPTAEPTEAPTAEPTVEPTAAPTAEPSVVTPGRALKPAGEALVYHTTSGGWYHTTSNCSKMTGAKLYPLSECVKGSKVYKRCRTCKAPLPEYVDQYCLWMDEESTCHTTDECPSFNGKWTLIPRDEALKAGHTGCVVCSAADYLQPNTTVEYIEYVAAEEIEAASEN